MDKQTRPKTDLNEHSMGSKTTVIGDGYTGSRAGGTGTTTRTRYKRLITTIRTGTRDHPRRQQRPVQGLAIIVKRSSEATGVGGAGWGYLGTRQLENWEPDADGLARKTYEVENTDSCNK